MHDATCRALAPVRAGVGLAIHPSTVSANAQMQMASQHVVAPNRKPRENVRARGVACRVLLITDCGLTVALIDGLCLQIPEIKCFRRRGNMQCYPGLNHHLGASS